MVRFVKMVVNFKEFLKRDFNFITIASLAIKAMVVDLLLNFEMLREHR
jgi:hypothetical protein